MATKSSNSTGDLNEQWIDAGRKIGLSVVDSQEKAWSTYASLQERIAANTPVDFVADAVRAQARVTRDLSDAYTAAARGLLRS